MITSQRVYNLYKVFFWIFGSYFALFLVSNLIIGFYRTLTNFTFLTAILLFSAINGVFDYVMDLLRNKERNEYEQETRTIRENYDRVLDELEEYLQLNSVQKSIKKYKRRAESISN